MATIKPIEGHSVHRIRSGQVIVDLVSVVKELVENSLDACATSIDIRFKNHGLDAVEIQDNGDGISKENYEAIGKLIGTFSKPPTPMLMRYLALKHYTSKLSSYEDLTSLQTFGFRGEALSSLCALSELHVVTARAEQAPRGTRLDFEMSGKLKSSSVVASQKGTTVIVENLFMNLPVRRRELVKNIKREYGKVLGILQAYACISLNIRISVSNQVPKGNKASVFATKSNPTTRENIANIFGAKTLPALIPLDLIFDMRPSTGPAQEPVTQGDAWNKQVRIIGHISKPIFGEGRQTPDRQMFFVNARPCGLPQVARAFNEVYKTYNLSQSPFIFANFVLDTNAYDVNVSPDKRTILLHDQGALLESLKASLIELFEKQNQTVPQSAKPIQKLPLFKQLTVSRIVPPRDSPDDDPAERSSSEDEHDRTGEEHDSTITLDLGTRDGRTTNLIHDFLGRTAQDRVLKSSYKSGKHNEQEIGLSKGKQKLINRLGRQSDTIPADDEPGDARAFVESDVPRAKTATTSIPILDFNQRMAEQQANTGDTAELLLSSSSEPQESMRTIATTTTQGAPGIVQNAFERMRPRRSALERATITIGPKTFTSAIGSPPRKRHSVHSVKARQSEQSPLATQPASQKFGSTLQAFAAPGTLAQSTSSEEDDASDDDSEESRIVSPEDLTDQGAKLYDYDASATREGAPIAEAGESPVDQSTEEDDEGSEDEYMDEEAKKAKEEGRVNQLIDEAEERAARPSEDDDKRAHRLLKGGVQKNSTTHIVRFIDTSIEKITTQLQTLQHALQDSLGHNATKDTSTAVNEESAEERLSLTVTKADFANMRIVGQFNLGFILTTRSAPPPPPPHDPLAPRPSASDLFIIDQHASDEIYNFERLQSSTTLQNQRLVHPRPLALTAIEEETLLAHPAALLKNGFLVAVDPSATPPTGHRCTLLALPTSRAVTFDTRDLEELLALLAESSSSADVPRPGKVRRLFAMRACRSSVMVGTALSGGQMRRLVRNMGAIERPWNCPHGRPTMRHLAALGGWEGWREGDGVVGMGGRVGEVDWAGWRGGGEGGAESEESEGGGGEDEGSVGG